jgi:hypothetical protein
VTPHETIIRLNQIRIDAEILVANLDQNSLVAQLAISACFVQGIDPYAGSPNWKTKVLNTILEDAMLQELKRVTTTQG